MSLNSGRISLFTHLENNWTKTPIVFKGDTAGDDYVKATDPWIYTYIHWDEEILRSLNGPNQGIYITPGLMAIRLYSRIEDGFAQVDQLTDSLLAVFRAKTIDNITLDRLQVGRDADDGKWYIRFLTMTFTMRTIQTI